MTKQTPLFFENSNIDISTLCGIDEAGRGPIAGPLVVAAVVLKQDIDGLADSKKLTPKRRQELYEIIKKSSKYYIHQVDAKKIDEYGLSKAINESLNAIKKFFGNSVEFLFDGNSSFGVSGIQTLIKADTKVATVSAASILAKVYRDNLMLEYAIKYPNYGFDKHKGYGTKAHKEAIKKYGYCPIHRKSFKINIDNLQKSLF